MYYARPLPRRQSASAENPVVAAFLATWPLAVIRDFHSITTRTRQRNARRGVAVRLGQRFARTFRAENT